VCSKPQIWTEQERNETKWKPQQRGAFIPFLSLCFEAWTHFTVVYDCFVSIRLSVNVSKQLFLNDFGYLHCVRKEVTPRHRKIEKSFCTLNPQQIAEENTEFRWKIIFHSGVTNCWRSITPAIHPLSKCQILVKSANASNSYSSFYIQLYSSNTDSVINKRKYTKNKQLN